MFRMNTIPILYDNDEIFVINKPSGLPVQGGQGIKHSLDVDFLQQSLIHKYLYQDGEPNKLYGQLAQKNQHPKNVLFLVHLVQEAQQVCKLQKFHHYHIKLEWYSSEI